MRRLFQFAALLGLLVWGIPAHAVIARAQACVTKDTSATSTTIALGSDVTANNLLFLAIRTGSDNDVAMTDTNGNTWNNGTRHFVSGTGSLLMSYVVNNTSAANTVTVDPAGGSTTIRIIYCEYSGTATASVLDTQINAATGTGILAQSASTTPSANNYMVLSFVMVSNTRTITATANYTLEGAVPAGTNNNKLALERWIQTTATATTGPMDIDSGGDTWLAGLAIFKVASAAADAGFNKRNKLEKLGMFE